MGVQIMVLSLEMPSQTFRQGFSVEHSGDDRQSATIPVGGQYLSVSAPNGSWAPGNIRWTSNDPDESTGVLRSDHQFRRRVVTSRFCFAIGV